MLVILGNISIKCDGLYGVYDRSIADVSRNLRLWNSRCRKAICFDPEIVAMLHFRR